MDEEKITMTEEYTPEPGPTDEEIERWERERREREEAEIAPFKALAEAMHERDELLAELMFNETMRELEG